MPRNYGFTKSELHQWYVVEKKTCVRIAQEHGCHTDTILKNLAKHGLRTKLKHNPRDGIPLQDITCVPVKGQMMRLVQRQQRAYQNKLWAFTYEEPLFTAKEAAGIVRELFGRCGVSMKTFHQTYTLVKCRYCDKRVRYNTKIGFDDEKRQFKAGMDYLCKGCRRRIKTGEIWPVDVARHQLIPNQHSRGTYRRFSHSGDMDYDWNGCWDNCVRAIEDNFLKEQQRVQSLE